MDPTSSHIPSSTPSQGASFSAKKTHHESALLPMPQPISQATTTTKIQASTTLPSSISAIAKRAQDIAKKALSRTMTLEGLFHQLEFEPAGSVTCQQGIITITVNGKITQFNLTYQGAALDSFKDIRDDARIEILANLRHIVQALIDKASRKEAISDYHGEATPAIATLSHGAITEQFDPVTGNWGDVSTQDQAQTLKQSSRAILEEHRPPIDLAAEKAHAATLHPTQKKNTPLSASITSSVLTSPPTKTSDPSSQPPSAKLSTTVTHIALPAAFQKLQQAQDQLTKRYVIFNKLNLQALILDAQTQKEVDDAIYADSRRVDPEKQFKLNTPFSSANPWAEKLRQRALNAIEGLSDSDLNEIMKMPQFENLIAPISLKKEDSIRELFNHLPPLIVLTVVLHFTISLVRAHAETISLLDKTEKNAHIPYALRVQVFNQWNFPNITKLLSALNNTYAPLLSQCTESDFLSKKEMCFTRQITQNEQDKALLSSSAQDFVSLDRLQELLAAEHPFKTITAPIDTTAYPYSDITRLELHLQTLSDYETLLKHAKTSHNEITDKLNKETQKKPWFWQKTAHQKVLELLTKEQQELSKKINKWSGDKIDSAKAYLSKRKQLAELSFTESERIFATAQSIDPRADYYSECVQDGIKITATLERTWQAHLNQYNLNEDDALNPIVLTNIGLSVDQKALLQKEKQNLEQAKANLDTLLQKAPEALQMPLQHYKKAASLIDESFHKNWEKSASSMFQETQRITPVIRAAISAPLPPPPLLGAHPTSKAPPLPTGGTSLIPPPPPHSGHTPLSPPIAATRSTSPAVASTHRGGTVSSTSPIGSKITLPDAQLEELRSHRDFFQTHLHQLQIMRLSPAQKKNLDLWQIRLNSSSLQLSHIDTPDNTNPGLLTSLFKRSAPVTVKHNLIKLADEKKVHALQILQALSETTFPLSVLNTSYKKIVATASTAPSKTVILAQLQKESPLLVLEVFFTFLQEMGKASSAEILYMAGNTSYLEKFAPHLRTTLLQQAKQHVTALTSLCTDFMPLLENSKTHKQRRSLLETLERDLASPMITKAFPTS